MHAPMDKYQCFHKCACAHMYTQKKGVCNIIAISIKIAIEFKLQKY